MEIDYESSRTWRNTLGVEGNKNIEKLRESYFSSREKIASMLKSIESEIKGLTVHDISHIDSLWHVSDEIIGHGDYLNPAEGFILGCAFLIHDAAHVSAAYSGGLASLRLTSEWKDLVGLRYQGNEPAQGTDDYSGLLFDVTRIHHAKQAKEIVRMSWVDQSNDTTFYFIDNPELRNTYSEIIGLIAESHNWSAEKTFDTFQHRKINPPGFLNEKDWEVDCLKIAFILRTADASHIDSGRAPSYLFSFLKPEKISKLHWLFQNRLGKVKLTNNQVRITAGTSFKEGERSAWWLAFDTAKMIDRELKSAHHYLTSGGREPLSAQSVLGIESPLSFSNYVAVDNWVPDDTSIYISNLPHLVKTLGGQALYGNDETVAFRELIQNGMDSINAAVALEYLEIDEGKITISIDDIDEGDIKFSITDNGLGMSKYVMKNVLLDFGNSLWKSNDVINEHPTLFQNNFSSVGKFGIGFYSVFMISSKVDVITRRYENKENETTNTWKLRFEDGLNERPYITTPTKIESLKRSGTKVTFQMRKDRFLSITNKEKIEIFPPEPLKDSKKYDILINLKRVVSYLFPASDIDISVEYKNEIEMAVKRQDWKIIDPDVLMERRFLKPFRPWSNQLFPIYEGEILIGRLSIEAFGYFTNSSNYAVVCHKGIRSGKIYGVGGICLTDKNNDKAERTDCKPSYSKDSWVAWADLITTETPEINENCLVRLHPLVPEKDLKVWQLNDERCFLLDVISFLRDNDEILIHVGGIYYSSDEAMSEGSFDDDFLQVRNLVIVPDVDDASDDDKVVDFISTLYEKKINYLNLILETILSVFDGATIEKEVRVIGCVNEHDVLRMVTSIKI